MKSFSAAVVLAFITSLGSLTIIATPVPDTTSDAAAAAAKAASNAQAAGDPGAAAQAQTAGNTAASQAESAESLTGGTLVKSSTSSNNTPSRDSASSYISWSGPSVKAPWETVWFNGPECVAMSSCGDMSKLSCECSYITCYNVNESPA